MDRWQDLWFKEENVPERVCRDGASRGGLWVKTSESLRGSNKNGNCHKAEPTRVTLGN